MLAIASFGLGKMVITAQELPIDQKNQHKMGIKFEPGDHWNDKIIALK